MAGICFPFDSLFPLVKHHIGILQRYEQQSENVFSILFIYAKDLDRAQVIKSFAKILRQSDAIFEVDDCYFIVLAHTPKEGAIVVQKQLTRFIGQEFDSIISTYGEDGTNEMELLDEIVTHIGAWLNIDLFTVAQTKFGKK